MQTNEHRRNREIRRDMLNLKVVAGLKYPAFGTMKHSALSASVA